MISRIEDDKESEATAITDKLLKNPTLFGLKHIKNKF